MPKKIHGILDLQNLSTASRLVLPEIFRGVKLDEAERNSVSFCGLDPLSPDTKTLLHRGPVLKTEFSKFRRNYFSTFPSNASIKFFDCGLRTAIQSIIRSRTFTTGGKTCEVLTLPFCITEAQNIAGDYEEYQEFSSEEVLSNLNKLGLRPLEKDEVDSLLKNDMSTYEGTMFIVEDPTQGESGLKYLRMVDGVLVDGHTGGDDCVAVGFNQVRYKGDPLVDEYKPMTDNPFTRQL